MPISLRAARPLLAALLVAAIGAGLLIGSVAAHERRDVGEYQFVVGFLNEPAIIEEPNGLSLRVTRGEEPVEGLVGSLQAEILYGDERLPLELRAAFGDPGHYVSDVIPTETGTYSFHIFGDIEGSPVDETFVGGPDTFSEVEGRDAMTFPNQIGTVGDVQATAADAEDSAGTAMMLGIGGLVAGLLGLVLGGLAFARSGSKANQGRMATQDASD